MVAAFAARGLCESVFELCLASHEILVSEPLLDEIRRRLATKVKLDRPTIRASSVSPRNDDAAARHDSRRRLPQQQRSARPGVGQDGACQYLVTGDGDLLVLHQAF